MGNAAAAGVQFVQRRLPALSKSLGDRPYLDGDRFTAGDLMVTTVRRILKHTDIVTSGKRLAALCRTLHCAFKRAFDAQKAITLREFGNQPDSALIVRFGRLVLAGEPCQ